MLKFQRETGVGQGAHPCHNHDRILEENSVEGQRRRLPFRNEANEGRDRPGLKRQMRQEQAGTQRAGSAIE